MTAREQGFLLLTSELGVPGRKTLTVPQLRTLGQRVCQAQWTEFDRELTLSDLQALGYGGELAQRILILLEDRELLEYYCRRGQKLDCHPLTRVSERYPDRLRKILAMESPGCLWCKGDLSLLEKPKVSLVGSRELLPENRDFAREMGRQAAQQGYVLVSGNARGADQTAQNACLEAGGCVISVVADALTDHSLRRRVLYISEDGFDAPFSAQRALSRNRIIHSLGQMTFVAQCGYQAGGTWDGTVRNLRFGYSPVYCYQDRSPAQELLTQMGAQSITKEQLKDLSSLPKGVAGFFEEETL